MTEDQIKVHGSYAFEEYDADYNPAWERVRELTVKEAAVLVGLEGQKSEIRYLWPNKCLIVPDLAKRGEGITGGQAIMGEMLGGVWFPSIAIGMEAVYLHDGQYFLLKRLLPRDHSWPKN